MKSAPVEPIFNVAAEARGSIRHLAQIRGLDLSAKNIQQVMIDNPDMNALRLTADEWQYGYRRTADGFRAQLTKAQRRSFAACGPYKLPNGKTNEVYSNRSAWLCWLCKRGNNSLALTLRQRQLLAAAYHDMTLKEWDKAERERNANR